MQTQIRRGVAMLLLFITLACSMYAMDASANSAASAATVPETLSAVSAAAAAVNASTGTSSDAPADIPADTSPEARLNARAPAMMKAGVTRLINRDHTLSPDYVPDGLFYVRDSVPENVTLKSRSIRATATPWKAFTAMMQAAGEDGVDGFYLVCVYRSYAEQLSAFNKKVKRDKTYGQDRNVPIITAHPGASEHQAALAFDITSVKAKSTSEKFASTEQGIWLLAHCHEYGFIHRYIKGKEQVTGIVYEPWHFRYVGKELAGYLYQQGLALEEFYSA